MVCLCILCSNLWQLCNSCRAMEQKHGARQRKQQQEQQEQQQQQPSSACDSMEEVQPAAGASSDGPSQQCRPEERAQAATLAAPAHAKARAVEARTCGCCKDQLQRWAAESVCAGALDAAAAGEDESRCRPSCSACKGSAQSAPVLSRYASSPKHR